jgi:lysozyme
MTGDTLAALLADLRRDEGLRLKPYVDTVGKLSIGYGRNLTDNGISITEAEAMLRADALRHVEELRAALPWVDRLDPVRQRAIANLAFNLGLPRLLKFRETLDRLKRGDYTGAAVALADSEWFRQVKSRGPRIVRMVRDGVADE